MSSPVLTLWGRRLHSRQPAPPLPLAPPVGCKHVMFITSVGERRPEHAHLTSCQTSREQSGMNNPVIAPAIMSLLWDGVEAASGGGRQPSAR